MQLSAAAVSAVRSKSAASESMCPVSVIYMSSASVIPDQSEASQSAQSNDIESKRLIMMNMTTSATVPTVSVARCPLVVRH